MATEDSIAAAWILAKLTGSVALTAIVGTRISDWPAPQGYPVGAPYVVYRLLAGIDLDVLGGQRVWTNMVWMVRVYAETRSFAGTLGQAWEAIDAALQLATGTPTGGIVYVCKREGVERDVDPDTPGWRYRGGRYRVIAQVT